MRRRSSSRWMLWLVLFAALLVGIRWYRCRSESSETKPPPPAPGDAPRVVAIDAPVTPPRVSVDAAEVAEPPQHSPMPVWDDWYLEAISLDRATALVVRLSSRTPPAFRLVDIDTKNIEVEVEFTELFEMSDTFRTEGVARHLAAARTLLKRFPLGNGGGMASSPDGESGAFNVAVDTMYVVHGDKVGAAIPKPAAYTPLITPDGKTLLFSGYDGRHEDDGKYSLFTQPLAGGRPTKVVGTDGWNGSWRLSKAGTLRIVVGQKGIPTCVLDVTLVKPFKVIGKHCMEGADQMNVEMSPSGDWIAWSEFLGETEKKRVRSFELATGRAGIDVRHDGFLNVSDVGRVLISDFDDNMVDYDATSGSPRIHKIHGGIGCEFRGTREIVCWHNGRLTVTDIPD